MAADRAGGGARRIEQHRIGGSVGRQTRHRPRRVVGVQAEPRQIFVEPRQPRRRAVDGGHGGAGGGELRRLAARRRAEIDDSSCPRHRRAAAPAAPPPRPAPTRRPRRSRAVPATCRPPCAAGCRSAAARLRAGAPIPRHPCARSGRAAARPDGLRRCAGRVPRHRPRPTARHSQVRVLMPRRVLRRDARRALRASRRSTALTRPLNPVSSSRAVSSTDSLTAAWAGVSRNRSCAAPSRSISCTIVARAGSGRSRSAAMTASIWPSRRSVVATSMCAKPRSRGSSLHGADALVEGLVERPLAAQHRAENIQGGASGGLTAPVWSLVLARLLRGALRVRVRVRCRAKIVTLTLVRIPMAEAAVNAIGRRYFTPGPRRRRAPVEGTLPRAARTGAGAARRAASAARTRPRPHQLQPRDAVLHVRVGREQLVHRAAEQRIDDEQMRRRRLLLGLAVGDLLRWRSCRRASAEASQSGWPQISAPMRSASYSRVREIAICTSMAAIGATIIRTMRDDPGVAGRPSSSRLEPNRPPKLASMPMAPAITAVIVMISVSRFLTCASSCAMTPAISSREQHVAAGPVVAATAACSGCGRWRRRWAAASSMR